VAGFHGFLVGAALTVYAGGSFAQGLETYDITSQTISSFKIGSDETRFGRLEYVGGFAMTSSGSNFGALSAFRFLDGGSKFVGVADTGFWFAGVVSRDADGKPTGIADFRIRAMLDDDRAAERPKWETDAEGLLVNGNRVTASFEREHRISTGDIDAQTLDMPLTEETLPVPARELRNNRGFETLALAPMSSALTGAKVAVTEKSLNKQGNIFAAVMDGPEKGIFYVARNGEFDITDGDFLPNGDLLLLERKFNMADGIAMRLRLISGETIKKGATVDGAILLEANMGYQIDNMEALDVWQDSAGGTRVTLMSDDNHSILQRSILLEFKLLD
jgi:hypothetical protein